MNFWENTKSNRIIILFLIISALGLLFPWFYFEKSVDYSIGLHWIKNPILIVGFLGSFIFIFLKERSKTINIVNLIFLLCIPIYCIYLFLTWHILTITGEFNIETSLTTTHYGFYITLVSSIIAIIMYMFKIKK